MLDTINYLHRFAINVPTKKKNQTKNQPNKKKIKPNTNAITCFNCEFLTKKKIITKINDDDDDEIKLN